MTATLIRQPQAADVPQLFVRLADGVTLVPAVVLVGSDGSPATQGYSCSLSITRTADTNAYTANDVIGTGTGSAGAALTFANVVGGAGEYMITSAKPRAE